MPYHVPAEIVARFRVVAQERLGRVEAAWLELGQRPDDHALAQQMGRELHTLKGDAHILGFRDASRLCHKLEELLASAELHQFRVAEEFDMVVTMAIQFLGMIIRRKAGGPVGGIDLPGFIRHVDDVLRDAAASLAPAEPAELAMVAPTRFPERDALSAETRGRLAMIATDLFVAALAVEPRAQARLLASWEALVRQISRLESVRLDQRLLRHAQSAKLIAGDLGRPLSIQFEVGDHAVGAHIAEAIDDAMVHAVRNAIDHGVEPPGVRAAAGKPATARLRIAATVTSAAVEVVIEDDGAGIDLEAVRRRAVERRLVASSAAPGLDEEALFELLFTPGFSTRELADELSGRGIGLDAVRAAIRTQGGEVTLRSTRGQGTTVTVRLPNDAAGIDVHQLASPRLGVFLAVPQAWQPGEASAASVAGVPELDLTRFGLDSPDGDPRVVLRHGDERVAVPAVGPAVSAFAMRVCPTPPEHPLEVVRIDDNAGLLVRPDVLAALGRTARRGA